MRGPRLGAHPLHPALVHFPVACWSAVPVMDVLHLTLGAALWWQCAFWLIATGSALALPAMAAGFLDLVALPAEHPAQATAQRHLLLMGSAWSVFVVDWLLRSPGRAPGEIRAWIASGVSALGFALLAAGAYAGAQLVYGFGVGQNPGHGRANSR